MELINPSRTKQVQILPYDKNPAPLVLTGAWQDLPSQFIINVQDTTGIGVWLHLTAAAGFKIRVQATYEKDSNDFYSLPIQSPSSTVVGLEFQEYEFLSASGEVKLVFAVSTSDVIRYLKIQVQGTGQVEKAFITAKGKT